MFKSQYGCIHFLKPPVNNHKLGASKQHNLFLHRVPGSGIKLVAQAVPSKGSKPPRILLQRLRVDTPELWRFSFCLLLVSSSVSPVCPLQGLVTAMRAHLDKLGFHLKILNYSEKTFF